MKLSFFTSSLLAATLWQGEASAQSFDLPDPGVISDEVKITPVGTAKLDELFAGSLRLSEISRKSEGSQLRVVLTKAVRVSQLDVRVLSGKVQIRDVRLLTVSGVEISVQNLKETNALETEALLSSENISSNEEIAEIVLTAEAFSDGAALFLTALSPTEVPKLILWRPAPSSTSVLISEPGQRVTITFNPKKATCRQGYCVNDIVIFQRQRAKILEIYPDGRVLLIQRGIRRVVTTVSEIRRPSLPPYGG